MYKLGDWWVRCDICGRKRYFSDCQMNYDNMLVCSDTCWEERHPQEFVRSVRDMQRVPVARPDFKMSQKTTTLSSSASQYAVSIVVSDASYISRYDSIGIELDGAGTATDLSQKIQWVTVNPAPSGTTIYISEPLIDNASSGNIVYLSYHNKITATTYTATML